MRLAADGGNNLARVIGRTTWLAMNCGNRSLFLIYGLYCNELVVFIEKNFKAPKNSIVGNELSDCVGGKPNNPVVLGACDDNLRAALIISQVLLSR